MAFEAPNISVSKKTNEENMQITKSYLTNLSEELNYKMNKLENEIADLRSEIAELKSGKE